MGDDRGLAWSARTLTADKVEAVIGETLGNPDATYWRARSVAEVTRMSQPIFHEAR